MAADETLASGFVDRSDTTSVAFSLFKSALRRTVTKQREPLIMRSIEPRLPDHLPVAGLYLHVPFCENLCPYCPYNRWKYDPEQYAVFERAVTQEIAWVSERVSVGRVPSLYVGGGTPTVNPDGLLRILSCIRAGFSTAESTCIELHPGAASPDTLNRLRQFGVDMVSVGAQSFQDHHLTLIGRTHSSADAQNVIRSAAREGFDTVNVDIMFTFPGQTTEELRCDVETAVACGANQISTYPMFGFPYSELGQEIGLARVKRPGGRLTRRMLATIDEVARSNGFHRCAVWSWIRPGHGKFSSVSRHHYLGFGPSAGSMTGQDFFINTFHVAAYAEAVNKGQPTALCLRLNQQLEMAYWLYWRLYELTVSSAGFESMFGADLVAHFGKLFWLPRLLGFMRRTDSGYEVTESGAYWIHRFQNEFSLDYIGRIWGLCRRVAWPEEVRL